MKLDEQVRRIKEMMLIESGEGPHKGRAASKGGGTASSSSGSFMSAGSWEPGGILHNNGRKNDIGELPQEVDITGGDSEEITLSVDDIFGTDPSVDVMDTIDNLIGSAIPIGPGDPKGDDDGPGGPGDPHGDGDDDGPGDPRGDDDDDGGGYDDDDDDGPDKPDGPDPHDDVKEPEKDEPRDSMDFVPCCEPCGNGMWKRCNTDDCVYSTISDCELRGDNDTYSESKKSLNTFND